MDARSERGEFLKAAAFGLAAARLSADPKPLRGIFPILQSPYSDSGQLDTETLAKEVKFLDRLGVHGVVWPQLASEWSELKPEERFSGAESIMAPAKAPRCAAALALHGPTVEPARP